MKFIIYIIIIASSFVGCTPTGDSGLKEQKGILMSVKSDLEKMNLRGSVKSIKTESFDENQRGISEEIHIIFNSVGNKIEEEVFQEKFSGKYIFTYNTKGLIVEKELLTMEGELFEKWHYLYNDKGQLKERNTDFYFSNYGELTSEPNGDTKCLYEYNSLGKLIDEKFITLVEGPGPFLRYKYKYDSKGTMIEEKEYNSANALVSTNRYSYDDKGNALKIVSNKSDYTQTISNYHYEYDEKSNWVKKSVSWNGKNGKQKHIELREIEYNNL